MTYRPFAPVAGSPAAQGLSRTEEINFVLKLNFRGGTTYLRNYSHRQLGLKSCFD